MKIRFLLITALVGALPCFPIEASQPQGFAAKLFGNPNLPAPDCISLPRPVLPSFEWFQAVGTHDLDPAHTVAVELAVIPFRTGPTFLVLEETGGGTFMGIVFLDGIVSADGGSNGVPYLPTAWNDVLIRLRPATQDFTITVNGVTGGPFPYADFCPLEGGCLSLQQLELSAPSAGDDAVAWLDSFRIYDETTAPFGLIYEVDFDHCWKPDIQWGGLLISEPPRPPGRTKPSKCR